MRSFNLPNNSITLKAIVIRIVSKQQTTILLYLILIQHDEVRIAVIGEIDRYEVWKLKARVASVDISYDKRDGVLIHLNCQIDM